MTSKEAEETLGLIRALMERSTRYTNLSGHAGIAAGVAALAFTPALVAGLVFTAILTQVGQAMLLPGVWMMMWGVGALAMSLFTPRAFSLLGVAFMAAGTFTLFAHPGNDVLCMGLSFGGIHLAYG